MTSEDITESRVLKANHLASIVLVTDPIFASTEQPEANYNAIVELAGAVLRLRYLADSPQGTKPEASPPTTPQLDVKEPLHVVVSRCNHEDIRARALDLLSRFYTESS